jgi:hypothetical protein
VTDIRSLRPDFTWAATVGTVALLAVPVVPGLAPGSRIVSKAGAIYHHTQRSSASSKVRLAPSAHASAKAVGASAARAGAR